MVDLVRVNLYDVDVTFKTHCHCIGLFLNWLRVVWRGLGIVLKYHQRSFLATLGFKILILGMVSDNFSLHKTSFMNEKKMLLGVGIF